MIVIRNSHSSPEKCLLSLPVSQCILAKLKEGLALILRHESLVMLLISDIYSSHTMTRATFVVQG